MDILTRYANENDAKEILNIYEYYVKNTAISFEYEVPSILEFKERIKNTIKKYPYILAIIDNKIVGFAYAGEFVGREAYKFSAELSIYIDKNYQRQGIGRKLYKNWNKT